MAKLRISFLIIAFLVIGFLWHINSKRSDFFTSSFISYDSSLWPHYEIPKLTLDEKEKIQAILSQPFKFLGSGNQTFAFESADGAYVLKFFKFQHLRKSSFADYLPEVNIFTKFKERLAQSKARRISQVFHGHFIAYTLDKENSGLIYARLNSDEKFNLRAKVLDNAGLSHEIPLDNVVFVLQKKGISFRKVLGQLLDQDKVAEASKLVNSLLDMYISEYQQGIYDRDHNVMHNVGFVDATPMRIDVGKLKYDQTMKDPVYFKKDLRNVVFNRIDKWMRNYYPFYRKTISDEMIKYLHSKQIEL